MQAVSQEHRTTVPSRRHPAARDRTRRRPRAADPSVAAAVSGAHHSSGRDRRNRHPATGHRAAAAHRHSSRRATAAHRPEIAHRHSAPVACRAGPRVVAHRYSRHRATANRPCSAQPAAATRSAPAPHRNSVHRATEADRRAVAEVRRVPRHRACHPTPKNSPEAANPTAAQANSTDPRAHHPAPATAEGDSPGVADHRMAAVPAASPPAQPAARHRNSASARRADNFRRQVAAVCDLVAVGCSLLPRDRTDRQTSSPAYCAGGGGGGVPGSGGGLLNSACSAGTVSAAAQPGMPLDHTIVVAVS